MACGLRQGGLLMQTARLVYNRFVDVPMGRGHFSDAAHHVDRLQRKLASRGLCGKHTGVGTVEDGVGNVADFRARWARRSDHALQHLRRDDDGNALLVGNADDALLGDRDKLGMAK